MNRRAAIWAIGALFGVLGGCRTLPDPVRIPTPVTAADVVPGGTIDGERYPVEVVDAKATFRIEADGRQVRVHHLSYRVRTLDGLGAWADVGATWAPWFQARPEIVATVTRPDGKTFTLDPNTLSEAPVASGQKGMYTDRRRLEAPLPGLSVGALVEQTVTTKDERPFLPGGSLGRFYFGLGVPVPRAVVELDVPEQVPLTYQVRGIDAQATSRRADGRVRLTLEAVDVPAQGPTRLLLPPEHPRHAHVLFSTVPSWEVAAAAYAGLVEGQLDHPDVGALLKGLDATRPRDEIIRTLLSRLHGEIRYTGLELGEQAILPRRPEETLGRRFGDCKDKGVLLIALLRAVGIEAHLAVLRSGFGEDVVPEVPGLELFDHAIVYVPGPEPLWIDATQELLPLGELPDGVQGRHALVVQAGGPGLVRVPEAAPEHNRYTEIRTVRFGDWGPVQVTERTEATGSMELRLRGQLLGSGRSQVETSLSRYVKRAYRAEGIGEVRYTPPRDVSVPFSVEVEAIDARVGYTARTEAKVQLRTPVLFGFLPELLRDAALGSAAQQEDRELAAAAALVRTRATDLVLPRAFVAEVRYLLVPPRGFEFAKLPEPAHVALGPGAYDFSMVPAEDGGMWATLSLRTGPRRYSADDARAFVAGLQEVWDLTVPSVELVHTGAKRMKAGDATGGLAFYQRLLEAHPDDASQRARYAESLLDVGLGEAARVEAKAAAAGAGKHAPVFMALGHVLEHDPFGRRHAPGFDRKGALAAFDAALALEADHVGALLARARLLELDDAGHPARDPADWRRAAEAYRRARDLTGDTELDARLLIAMYWGRDYAGLHTLASGLSPEAPNVAMQLVSATMLHGAQAALRELDGLGLSSEVKQASIDTAALALARLRAYAEARALLQAALPSAPNAMALQERLSTLHDLAKVEPRAVKGRAPEDAVRRLLFAMLDPPIGPERLKSLFSARALDGDDPAADLSRLSEGLSVFSKSALRSDVPMAMVRDSLLSSTRFDVEGAPDVGFRVKGRMKGGAGLRESVWFVVREGLGYRVRTSESAAVGLGEEALHLLEKGRIAAGRRWLEWATETLREAKGEDVLAQAPFVALRNLEAPLIVQAAALTAMGPRAARAIRHLERAKAALTKPVAQAALEHALWMAHRRAGHKAETIAASARLAALLPESSRAFWLQCEGLVFGGRGAEARKLALARLEAASGDALALGCLSEAALAAGDVKAARGWLRRQSEAGETDPAVLNNIGWLALFEGTVGEADVEAAMRSNVLTRFDDPSKLHTLAALYLEQGKLREAHQLFVKRLDLRGADGPAPVDWYLVGRARELAGLRALAVEAYRKVTPEPREVDSTHKLARARLEALGATP